jgi:L-amino acid N-acyltransferase YncA
VIFQREAAKDALEEILPLMQAHWAEIAYDDTPFDPDTDAYVMADAGGLLRLFVARDEGGRIAGYVAFLVAKSLNHRTLKHAHETGVFLRKTARRGRLAFQLLDYADAALVGEGVRAIHYTAPKEHPGLGNILARRGYKQEETIWVRRFACQQECQPAR